VEIRVNGKTEEVAEGVTLLTLLEELQVNRQQVAVEVNAELVPRERHSECRLNAGDRVEVVTLVGGG
jgi:sulfur carrier protein